ncbi:MAG TPA: hypothetical protein PKK26_15365, partial [Candidatus Wallbacteria bacterium]|nr:hypothetical protein [Candidatus Wallbacteria bacterium]
MRRKSIISISLFLALTLVSPGIADDKAVGRNYNPNPSQIMKQYHMKAVAPLTADSVEAILIGECKDNIPLQEKSGDWGQLGFTIRENQNDQANFLKSNSVVNSDDPNVIKLVNQLKGRTPLETSQNILKWVDD